MGKAGRLREQKAGAADTADAACATTTASKNDQLREIQTKVHYAFRNFAKKQKRKQNLQVSSSSTYLFERQQDKIHFSKRTRRGNCVSAFCDTGSGGSDDGDV